MKRGILILVLVLGSGFLHAESTLTNANSLSDHPIKIERVALKINMLKADLITVQLQQKTTMRNSIKLLKHLKKVIKEAEREVNI